MAELDQEMLPYTREASPSTFKERLVKVIADDSLPILCNLNFGHSYPRTVLAYGAKVELDGEKGELRYLEPLLR